MALRFAVYCVFPFTIKAFTNAGLGFFDEPPRQSKLVKTSENQLFCTNCGKILEDSQAGFCPGCGAPTNAVRDPSAGITGVSGSAFLTVPWRGGQVAWGFLFLALLLFGILLTATVVLKLTGDFDRVLFALDSNQALFACASSLLLGLVILLIVWYLGLRPTGGSVALLGLRAASIPAGPAILWTVGVLVSSFGATFLYSTIMEWIGVDWLLPPESYAEIVFEGPAVVLTFLALAVWTPLTEELFFRGFVFAGLVHRFGAAGAVVFSALIFSAFHVVPGVLIPIFITGLLLAWLYHRTGSLWPSIAAHAGQNGAALLATIYGPSLSLNSV